MFWTVVASLLGIVLWWLERRRSLTKEEQLLEAIHAKKKELYRAMGEKDERSLFAHNLLNDLDILLKTRGVPKRK